MKRYLFLLLAVPAFAAPLPDDVRDAVEQVRKYDYTQPRTAPFTLEQFTPKADAEQRAALATLLEKAMTAPDSTPLGRTILGQRFAQIAGNATFALPAPPSKATCLAEATDTKPAARIAGLSSLARFYPNDAAPVLAKAIHDADPVVSATAIQLAGPALAAQLPKLDGARQALALSVLAERKVASARGAVAELVNSGDELVRLAAISALGALGDASSVPVLVKLAGDEKAAVKSAAENALARLAAPGVDEIVLKGVMSGAPAERALMINVAAARETLGLGPVLLIVACDKEEAVQTAALKSLARTGGADVYPHLVEMLSSVRSPALENAVIAVGRRLDDPSARLAPLLALLKRAALPAEAQDSVMRTLAPIGGAEALAVVRERLKTSDAAVRALCDWPDASALEDLKKLAEDASASTVHRALAARAVTRLSAPPPSRGGKASSRPSVSTAARREALTKSLAAGTRLVAYLDCGPEKEAKSADGVQLRVVRGSPWKWADEPAATVAFEANAVVVEVGGLDTKKKYQLGFTWWDHDGNGRAQSVWIGGQKVLEKTALPHNQGPATLSVAIPASGKATIEFRKEAQSNAVVSEVWLVEGGAPLATATATFTVVAAPVATTPVVKANAGAAKKVLIVTGLEYPGHKWRETAPVLVEAIGADKRLEVSVVEDPKFLASGTGILPVSSGRPSSRVPGLEAQATGLLKYDVIVLNYQNHNVAAPEGALANLKSAVEGGTGLVLFHFACGAFIDWPTKTVAKDFFTIAGRAWNPKLRGHDPYGAFKVSITDAQHPITKGLADFETTDELYTCLDGDVPMQVLAKATSKVDKKDYPMAFVLTPGKGRTFHCVLGHDLKALGPVVKELYRRGTAWAAGLAPKE
jgi:type 1 glutamine amidotransferase/HEAT repeat protein